MSEFDATRISFQISWPKWALVGLIAAGGIVVFGVHVQDLENTLIFAGALTATGATVVAALYSVFSYELQRMEYNTNIKKRGAMAYMARWSDPSMYDLRVELRAVLKGEDEKQRQDLAIEKEVDVSHVLNFLEEMCAAIKFELVDEPILEDQFAGIVVAIWKPLGAWIEHDRAGNKKQWENLEQTYYKWAARRNKESAA